MEQGLHIEFLLLISCATLDKFLSLSELHCFLIYTMGHVRSWTSTGHEFGLQCGYRQGHLPSALRSRLDGHTGRMSGSLSGGSYTQRCSNCPGCSLRGLAQGSGQCWALGPHCTCPQCRLCCFPQSLPCPVDPRLLPGTPHLPYPGTPRLPQILSTSRAPPHLQVGPSTQNTHCRVTFFCRNKRGGMWAPWSAHPVPGGRGHTGQGQATVPA